MISVYIPSRARPNVATLACLPSAVRKHTTLVIRKDEEDLYDRTFKLFPDIKKMVLPEGTEGISATRQYIIENCDETMCMLDDDFTSFGIKHNMQSNSITMATSDEIIDAFHTLENILDTGTAHAGFFDRPRCGLHRGDMVVYNKMMMQVLGYRASVIRENNLKFTDVKLAQDKHMTLSLLERGYHNKLLTYFTFNCYGTQAKGGCSVFRTADMINEQALLLQKLHPECVTITPKTVNYRGMETTVNKVRISWQKAYNLFANADCAD